MDIFLEISHSMVWICAKGGLSGKIARRRALKDTNLAIDILLLSCGTTTARSGGHARYGNRALQTRLTFDHRCSNELLKKAIYEKNLRVHVVCEEYVPPSRSERLVYARGNRHLCAYLIRMLSASSTRAPRGFLTE
jgi:hypothetical protein